MRLAQEKKLPGSIKGWELFDMESWTTTEFQRNVNLRRALEGEMEKHLTSLDWIESVKVSLSRPEEKLYTSQKKPDRAAISIIPAYGHSENLQNKKLIKGIEHIVAMGIDGLTHENIVITGPNGERLNDFLDESFETTLKQAEMENKLQEKERKRLEQIIEEKMYGILPEDRYRVTVNVDMNFDQESYEKKEILPIILKPDNPATPYDDSVVEKTLLISEQQKKENYKGEGFIPEGPPGQEPNLPPGYKEKIDGFSSYNNEENTKNFINGEKKTTHRRAASVLARQSVSVTVDGTWEKERDTKGEFIFEGEMYKRKYVPFPPDELKKLENTIMGAINYDASRGDRVVVENIAFDRMAQFKLEDSAYIKTQKTQKTLLYSLLTLIGLFVLSLGYRLINKEILRRRRLKERELNRQRQLQRDEALRALESEAPVEGISEADKKRMDLQEKAEQVAAERPEDVAKLIRSWIAEA